MLCWTNLSLARVPKILKKAPLSVMKSCLKIIYIFFGYFLKFNLFGGTVLKLGSKRHHDVLLKGIDTLNDVGCFGLTELGTETNFDMGCSIWH